MFNLLLIKYKIKVQNSNVNCFIIFINSLNVSNLYKN